MSNALRSLVSSLFLVLPIERGAAQTMVPPAIASSASVFRVNAPRARAPLAIDGRLDDAQWTGAPVMTDFTQQSPDEGHPATQRTEVRVVVDGDAVYVAMRMFDSAPDSIVGTLARRDYDGYSDWAHVIIDSFHDRRTAFRFAVNPSGVKRDGYISGDQEWTEDLAWDAVWDVATRRDSLGWTAEFRIPLSQLRFATAGADDDVVWGVEFARDIARRGERSYWVPIPSAQGTFVSMFGTLAGVPVREARRRAELTPYSLARASRSNADIGNPLRASSASTAALGADFKVGLTSDLTITGTVNPDFGQIEADPSQVNLTGAETFFAERRPFFTEGSDLFRYSMSWGGWLFGDEQLFYSRRIGRMPQLDFPDSASFTSVPEPTRLLAAAKLSGHTRGWTVGVLSATTAREVGRYTHPVGEARAVIEPLTHYGMFRLNHDFEEGRSSIGVIGTTTNRQMDAAAMDVLHASAYAGGVEGRRRWSGGKYSVTGYLFGSVVAGSRAAIARTQTSFRHLFQRDAEAMGLDSNATALSGLASELRFSRNGADGTRFGTSAHVVTRGFDINDVGYITATNFVNGTGWLGHEHNASTRHTRLWASYLNWWGERMLSGGGEALGFNWWNRVVLQNRWEINGVIERRLAGTSPVLLRGGPDMRTPAQTLMNARVITDPRATLQWFVEAGAQARGDDGSRNASFGPGAVVRPTSRAELMLQPQLSWQRTGAQFIDNPVTAGGTRYLVGDLRQRTASITARGNYAFTPTLTIQAYAQPFISSGHYARAGEVVLPQASRARDRVTYFDDASITTSADGATVSYQTSGGVVTLDNPDFTFASLNANVVLRWEYRAGSTLYAVWNQGRSGESDMGNTGWRDLSRALLRTTQTNILLLKWSHYLGR